MENSFFEVLCVNDFFENDKQNAWYPKTICSLETTYIVAMD